MILNKSKLGRIYSASNMSNNFIVQYRSNTLEVLLSKDIGR